MIKLFLGWSIIADAAGNKCTCPVYLFFKISLFLLVESSKIIPIAMIVL